MSQSTLTWRQNVHHLHEALRTFRMPGRKMPVHMLFSTVRPARAGDGLLSEQLGWVVTTTSFDDVKHFATLAEAKLHVEAIFALQYS